MRNERAWRDSRGATMIEAAIVMPTFLLLIFGLLDIGSAVWERIELTDLSRRIVNQLAIQPGGYTEAACVNLADAVYLNYMAAAGSVASRAPTRLLPHHLTRTSPPGFTDQVNLQLSFDVRSPCVSCKLIGMNPTYRVSTAALLENSQACS